MSYEGIAVIKIAASCGVAMLAMACSIVRCDPTSHVPVVRMGHLTGGDGPFLTRMIVYDDGLLELQTIGLRKHCSRDRQAARRLLDLARSREFSSEVSGINADSFHNAPPDWEQVGVEVAGLTFSIRIDREPAAVAQFLKETDAIFRRAFGRHYLISLVPRPVTKSRTGAGNTGR